MHYIDQNTAHGRCDRASNVVHLFDKNSIDHSNVIKRIQGSKLLAAENVCALHRMHQETQCPAIFTALMKARDLVLDGGKYD